MNSHAVDVDVAMEFLFFFFDCIHFAAVFAINDDFSAYCSQRIWRHWFRWLLVLLKMWMMRKLDLSMCCLHAVNNSL